LDFHEKYCHCARRHCGTQRPIGIAADMPAKALLTATPVMTPGYNWTGFYIFGGGIAAEMSPRARLS
jgi:hypothetical protein